MVGVLVLTAWQVFMVRGALQSLRVELAAAQTSLSRGNLSAAQQRLEQARDEAGTAYLHSRGPVWWTASKLPWVGDDVTAIRTVAEVSRDLTAETMPSLLRAGGQLERSVLGPRDGQFDLAAMRRIQRPLEQGAAEMEAAAERVHYLETAGLIGQVRGPVEDLDGRLGQLADATGAASTAIQLLPGVLGASGERNYLAIFQNNAEIRAAGGMPGSLALFRADRGKVELARQGVNADLGRYSRPVLPLSAEERSLFTEQPVTFPQDAVAIPHFPRAAEILREMWRRAQDQTVDGVLSVDAVALSYLLEATGPVTVDGQQITAKTAVAALIRDPYLEQSAAEQDELYSDTAAAVFEKIRGAQFEPRMFLSALSRSVEERRLLFWSAQQQEQRMLGKRAIASELPDRPSGVPEVGVFLNDSASDKLSYYLDYRVDVQPRACATQGNQFLDVTVTLRSTVPKDLPMPPSLLGPGIAGVPAGTMRNSLYVYSPVGGQITEVNVDGEEVPFTEYSHRTREVSWMTLDNARGEKRVIKYEVRSVSTEVATLPWSPLRPPRRQAAGRSARQPVTERPFRILCVCIGNVCRSPVAERLLATRLGVEFDVSSAGVGAVVGHGVHPESAAALAQIGWSGDGFAARQLVVPMLRDAQLVLTATTEIRRAVLEEEPSVMRRAFTWVEFGLLTEEWSRQARPTSDGQSAADLVAWAARNRGLLAGRDLDTPDPIGRPPEAHVEAVRIIDEAVRQIAEVLAPKP